MKETTKYYVVKEKAVPEVLLKVVEAKKLMETRKAVTIQEAVDRVGISRSSFYKYKDDIFQFHDNSQGTTLTMTFNIDDEPGVLSDVLKSIADFGANTTSTATKATAIQTATPISSFLLILFCSRFLFLLT